MDEISKQNAIRIAVALGVIFAMILGILAVANYFEMSRVPELLGTYWPAAAVVGVFIGFVVVVMKELKRRRPEEPDLEEEFPVMDGEETPRRGPTFTMAADDPEGEAKPPRPGTPTSPSVGAAEVIANGARKLRENSRKFKVGFVVFLAIAFGALAWYLLTTVGRLEKTVGEVKEGLGAKADTGKVAKLEEIVGEHQSTIKRHNGEINDLSRQMGDVQVGITEAKTVADEAKTSVAKLRSSMAERLATLQRQGGELERKMDRKFGEVNSTLSAVSSEIATERARQDSVNRFLATRLPISAAEMDSLAAWFPRK